MKKTVYTLLLLLLSVPVMAQRITGNDDDDDKDDPYDKVTYFMFGINYISNNVYLGRKDTSLIPYYSPYIGYHFKNGIYGKAMASYTTAGGGSTDLATLEAGYDHTFGDHFNGGFNLDKFYYNKNSISVRANTKESVGINGQYGNDWVEPQVTADVNVNKKSTDFVTGLLLDHTFYFDKNTLQVMPAVAMYAGTQHYYDEYLNNRIQRKDKTAQTKKILANASKFKPLDYELSAKVTYRVTKWLFTLTPTYAIPVNPSVLALPKQTITEKLTNTFFVELDVCHR